MGSTVTIDKDGTKVDYEPDEEEDGSSGESADEEMDLSFLTGEGAGPEVIDAIRELSQQPTGQQDLNKFAPSQFTTAAKTAPRLPNIDGGVLDIHPGGQQQSPIGQQPSYATSPQEINMAALGAPEAPEASYLPAYNEDDGILRAADLFGLTPEQIFKAIGANQDEQTLALNQAKYPMDIWKEQNDIQYKNAALAQRAREAALMNQYRMALNDFRSSRDQREQQKLRPELERIQSQIDLNKARTAGVGKAKEPTDQQRFNQALKIHDTIKKSLYTKDPQTKQMVRKSYGQFVGELGTAFEPLRMKMEEGVIGTDDQGNTFIIPGSQKTIAKITVPIKGGWFGLGKEGQIDAALILPYVGEPGKGKVDLPDDPTIVREDFMDYGMDQEAATRATVALYKKLDKVDALEGLIGK